MSDDKPTPVQARRSPVSRLRLVLWIGALVIGVGTGAAIKLSQSHSSSTPNSPPTPPVDTWKAGVRKAPDFNLIDQNGKPVSLSGFRGRPVIVSFIDPLCRDFCPREASILSEAAQQLAPLKPAIVSVSVDPWADTKENFHQDALHWKLAPGWQWGVGSQAKLAAVWKSYAIEVAVTRKKIAGISVRYIIHTGAAYLIDGSGYERALFLYPFETKDVVDAANDLT